MAVFSAPLTTRLSDIVTRSNINTLHRHLPTLTPIHYINIKQVSWGLTSALSWPWQGCLWSEDELLLWGYYLSGITRSSHIWSYEHQIKCWKINERPTFSGVESWAEQAEQGHHESPQVIIINWGIETDRQISAQLKIKLAVLYKMEENI